MGRLTIGIALLALAATSVDARPVAIAAAAKPRRDGAHARVTFGQAGVLRPPREIVGRREGPLTPEEDTAKQIERLLRGPLRAGVTGLFVADARTGEALFAVNADDSLNPASNVKMISTATALELLGPEFRYPTRVLGAEPDATGAIHGPVYLLGSWDPTLSAVDFDELAAQLVARGVHRLDGDVVVGSDPTRDGIYRALMSVEVKAGGSGGLATASAPGFDLVTMKVTARTLGYAARPRLTFVDQTVVDPAGHVRLEVSVAGTIGKGGAIVLPVAAKERTANAAFVLRAALRAHQIDVVGDVRVEELGEFIGDSVVAGALPIELARHQSAPLADIIAHVNKWSINWLADRVIMTAAALANRTTPTMEAALDAMYGWLARHPHLAKDSVLVDTGSGLSYHTRITPHELVSVVRSAAGFTDGESQVSRAWLDSLSIAGTDGTLQRRFRGTDVRGRIHAKTGSLSTVIALSGVLDIDPTRPLAFSIVTNGDRPLSKSYVRKAHEQVVGVICKYLAKTAKVTPPPPPTQRVDVAPPAMATPPAPIGAMAVQDAVSHPPIPDDLDEIEPDPALDAETAGQK
jgi:D-alanyl-D-alanine carboxypeptidase/D-alanyl-D-alanine-endopeptidase (penicillin-binding protein 4)